MTKLPSMRREIAELREICSLQSARITALEASNAELRAKLNLDPPAPSIGDDYMTLKQAAGALGMSINGVKYHARSGALGLRKIGHRVLIERQTVLDLKGQTGDAKLLVASITRGGVG